MNTLVYSCANNNSPMHDVIIKYRQIVKLIDNFHINVYLNKKTMPIISSDYPQYMLLGWLLPDNNNTNFL